MRRFAGLAITAGLAAAVPERRQGGARWCVGEPLEEDEVSSPLSFLAGSSLGLNAAGGGGSRPGMILTEPLAGVCRAESALAAAPSFAGPSAT